MLGHDMKYLGMLKARIKQLKASSANTKNLEQSIRLYEQMNGMIEARDMYYELLRAAKRGIDD